MNVQERQMLVRDFHRMTGEPIKDAPEPPDEAQAVLRAKLVLEEALELAEALGVIVMTPVRDSGEASVVDVERVEVYPYKKPNLVAVVDALRDLEYVIHGTEIALGVADVTDETFLEVHRSNMEKQPVDYGKKAIKPAGWKPPKIADVLRNRFPRKALLFRS